MRSIPPPSLLQQQRALAITSADGAHTHTRLDRAEPRFTTSIFSLAPRILLLYHCIFFSSILIPQVRFSYSSYPPHLILDLYKFAMAMLSDASSSFRSSTQTLSPAFPPLDAHTYGDAVNTSPNPNEHRAASSPERSFELPSVGGPASAFPPPLSRAGVVHLIVPALAPASGPSTSATLDASLSILTLAYPADNGDDINNTSNSKHNGSDSGRGGVGGGAKSPGPSLSSSSQRPPRHASFGLDDSVDSHSTMEREPAPSLRTAARGLDFLLSHSDEEEEGDNDSSSRGDAGGGRPPSVAPDPSSLSPIPASKYSRLSHTDNNISNTEEGEDRGQPQAELAAPLSLNGSSERSRHVCSAPPAASATTAVVAVSTRLGLTSESRSPEQRRTACLPSPRRRTAPPAGSGSTKAAPAPVHVVPSPLSARKQTSPAGTPRRSPRSAGPSSPGDVPPLPSAPKPPAAVTSSPPAALASSSPRSVRFSPRNGTAPAEVRGARPTTTPPQVPRRRDAKEDPGGIISSNSSSPRSVLTKPASPVVLLSPSRNDKEGDGDRRRVPSPFGRWPLASPGRPALDKVLALRPPPPPPEEETRGGRVLLTTALGSSSPAAAAASVPLRFQLRTRPSHVWRSEEPTAAVGPGGSGDEEKPRLRSSRLDTALSTSVLRQVDRTLLTASAESRHSSPLPTAACPSANTSGLPRTPRRQSRHDISLSIVAAAPAAVGGGGSGGTADRSGRSREARPSCNAATPTPAAAPHPDSSARGKRGDRRADRDPPASRPRARATASASASTSAGAHTSPHQRRSSARASSVTPSPSRRPPRTTTPSASPTPTRLSPRDAARSTVVMAGSPRHRRRSASMDDLISRYSAKHREAVRVAAEEKARLERRRRQCEELERTGGGAVRRSRESPARLDRFSARATATAAIPHCRTEGVPASRPPAVVDERKPPSPPPAAVRDRSRTQPPGPAEHGAVATTPAARASPVARPRPFTAPVPSVPAEFRASGGSFARARQALTAAAAATAEAGVSVAAARTPAASAITSASAISFHSTPSVVGGGYRPRSLRAGLSFQDADSTGGHGG